MFPFHFEEEIIGSANPRDPGKTELAKGRAELGCGTHLSVSERSTAHTALSPGQGSGGRCAPLPPGPLGSGRPPAASPQALPRPAGTTAAGSYWRYLLTHFSALLF